MSEFKPVLTIKDVESLDDKGMIEGFLTGLRGDPEPGSDKSRSVWHGWRNGMVEAGFMQPDEAQRILAKKLFVYFNRSDTRLIDRRRRPRLSKNGDRRVDMPMPG